MFSAHEKADEYLFELNAMTGRSADSIEFYLNPQTELWQGVSKNYSLTEDFIRDFRDYVTWDWITVKQIMSDEFIEEFKDRILWDHLCKYKKLSEDFMRKYRDKINWTMASKYQNMSLGFMKEFKSYINWNQIFQNQKIKNSKFIEEFKDKITISELKIEMELAAEHYDPGEPLVIFKYQDY